MTCHSCPFKNSESAEQAMNWGCVPYPSKIMEIKLTTNQNWGCHSNPTKICSGFKIECKKRNLDFNSGSFLPYEKWYHSGSDCSAE